MYSVRMCRQLRLRSTKWKNKESWNHAKNKFFIEQLGFASDNPDAKYNAWLQLLSFSAFCSEVALSADTISQKRFQNIFAESLFPQHIRIRKRVSIESIPLASDFIFLCGYTFLTDDLRRLPVPCKGTPTRIFRKIQCGR